MKRLNEVLELILSFLPRRLPVGMTEFDKFADRIIRLSGEFADRDSMKFAIASQVIHLGPQKAYVADRFFIKSMVKAAANQVASQAFQDIKQKQDAARKAAEEKAKAAATTELSQVVESVE